MLSRPVAVEQGTATVPVRLAFSAVPSLAAGTPVQVAIAAEQQRSPDGGLAAEQRARNTGANDRHLGPRAGFGIRNRTPAAELGPDDIMKIR